MTTRYVDECREIEKLLSALAVCDTVGNEGAAILQEMIYQKKKKLVLKIYHEQHPRANGFNVVNGYYRSRSPMFYAKTEEELIEKLYQHYFSNSFESLYYSWISEVIAEGCRANKTVIEYQNIWEHVLKDDPITRKNVPDVKKKDIEHLFRRWTGNGLITKKEFTNRKTVLNAIFRYASEQDIIPFNPVGEIGTKGLKFKPEKKKKKSYTRLERQKLISYLDCLSEQTGYSLAIRFACYLPLRIGEIRGIMYSDVDFKRHTVTIFRQVQNDRDLEVNLNTMTLAKSERQQIVKDPKGNPEYSIREIPLTPEAEKIIKDAHHINPFREYLFMEYDRPLNGDTFNDWLRKYAKEAGVPYLSSHKLRFSVACHLYNGGKGLDLNIIQRILGHSNLSMTLHYLEAYDGTDITDYREDMERLLNVQTV